jgi:hypothetical protein
LFKIFFSPKYNNQTHAISPPKYLRELKNRHVMPQSQTDEQIGQDNKFKIKHGFFTDKNSK